MKDPMTGTGSEFTPDYEPLFNPGDFRRQGENRELMDKWTENLRKLRQEMEDEYNDSKKDMEKSLKGYSRPDNFGKFQVKKLLNTKKTNFTDFFYISTSLVHTHFFCLLYSKKFS